MLRGSQGTQSSTGSVKWAIQTVLWSAGGSWEDIGKTLSRGQSTSDSLQRGQTSSQGLLKNG